MSRQIAVRLPEESVAFIDEQVQAGNAASRADFVQRALERERRRLLAARDAELLAAQQADNDGLDALAAYAAELDTGLQ